MTRMVRGYTIIELIVVMVLVGILTAVAMPRILGSNVMAGTAWRQQIVSALRYAQKSAVSHRRLVCANVGAKLVTLTIAQSPGGACGPALPSPDGSPYSTSDNNVAATGAIGTIYFQPDGQITNNGGAPLVAATISITGEQNIRIDGVTGHVE